MMAFSSVPNTVGEGSIIQSPPAVVVLLFFVVVVVVVFFGGVVMWRSARAHKFHFLGKDQSTVAQRAETTVAGCFLPSCV